MALEDSVTKLTGAIEKLTGQIDVQVGLLKQIAAAGGGKPAAAAAAKPAAAKPAKLTAETFTDKFATYLGTGDKAAKKAQVKAMVAHFGAAKVSEIAEENWTEALGFLKQMENGEEPEYGEAAGDGEPLL